MTLQTGGSDQWGNLTAGIDLVRRVEGATVHALSTPLVTKSDGTKIGKTEGGSVWLDPSLTSPYAFFQFWLNADDADARAWLPLFSERPAEEIEALIAESVERPAARTAQRALAEELTRPRPRGRAAARRPRRPGGRCSAATTSATLGEETLGAALDGGRQRHRGRRGADDRRSSCSSPAWSRSLSEARRTVKEGGAYLNNERVTDADAVPGETTPGWPAAGWCCGGASGPSPGSGGRRS